MENISEAQGRADVAFAPYLPTLSGGISGGGFDLDVTGQASGFSFLPPGATVPIGLNLESGYGFAEVHMQWLICDFGRRSSHYCQAELGVEIARLQTDRADQTVANDVSVAYYKVLQTLALQRIAREAVHRAEDDLGESRNSKKAESSSAKRSSASKCNWLKAGGSSKMRTRPSTLPSRRLTLPWG